MMFDLSTPRIPTHAVIVGAVLVGSLAALPMPVLSQVRGSERSSVSQVSDGTTVIVDYARPHVRGRLPVFGGLVGWGHVWTPGANEATTFEADRDLTLNGVSIPKGRYSVWMVPAEGDWEVILDPNDALYHTEPPSEHVGQIRFAVTPEEGEFTEALTWDFPQVRPTGMSLRFRWATTSLPFQIEVEPTAVVEISPDEAHQLVGSYEMNFEGPPPPGAPPGAAPRLMQLDLRFDGDRLLGSISGAPPGLPSEMSLIPVAQFVFNPAWMMEGQVFETEVDMYFEFNVEDGQAVGFDVRGLEDRIMMRGRRSN